MSKDAGFLIPVTPHHVDYYHLRYKYQRAASASNAKFNPMQVGLYFKSAERLAKCFSAPLAYTLFHFSSRFSLTGRGALCTFHKVLRRCIAQRWRCDQQQMAGRLGGEWPGKRAMTDEEQG